MPNQLAIGMPPILVTSNNSPMIANLFNPNLSTSSHPIVFNTTDQYAGILDTGELIIQKGAEYNILDVNALLEKPRIIPPTFRWGIQAGGGAGGVKRRNTNMCAIIG